MKLVVVLAVLHSSASCLVFGKTVPSDETRPVSIEAVPFLATLVAQRGGRLEQLCGASILHVKFVVTAASCLDGLDANETIVLVGTSNPQQGDLYDIDSFIPHKKYFRQTGDYNVGLVKLKKRLAFSDKVVKVNVDKKKVKVGSLVNVVGWGSKNANTSTTLRVASIPVLRKRACQGGLGRIMGHRVQCAGVPGEGRGDCVSTEGGPVFKNGALVGVVTASGCGRLPGLYTRLDAVRGWVTATINDHLSYLDYLDVVVESMEEK